MTTDVLTFAPEDNVGDAMERLVQRSIDGKCTRCSERTTANLHHNARRNPLLHMKGRQHFCHQGLASFQREAIVWTLTTERNCTA